MKKYKLLILTADKSLPKWRTLKRKLQEIQKELANVKNGEFDVSIVYQNIVPEVVDGRITHEWMDGVSGPALKDGYDFVIFHMSQAQQKKWGIKPTLRGSAQSDFDLVGEAYLWADESTLRGRLNQFIQTVLHELRHILMRGMGLKDDTHKLHADGDIRGAFIGLDMARYQPINRNLEKQVNLLRQVATALGKLVGLRRRTTLNNAALKYIGKDASPADTTSDVTGCAESVSMVIRDVLPDFPIILGTWSLNERLKADRRFREVGLPMPGTIIISPTGTGDMRKVSNGHTGVLAEGLAIMSNNSNTGLWEQNYTIRTWQKRWGEAGYETYFYQLTQ